MRGLWTLNILAVKLKLHRQQQLCVKAEYLIVVILIRMRGLRLKLKLVLLVKQLCQTEKGYNFLTMEKKSHTAQKFAFVRTRKKHIKLQIWRKLTFQFHTPEGSKKIEK